jgi:hypothetical protein
LNDCSAFVPDLRAEGVAVEQFFLLFFFVGYCAAIIVPVARILKRVGITPWVSIVALIPFANLFCLWFFAFSPWPSDSAETEQEAEWSEADKEKFRQLMRQQ